MRHDLILTLSVGGLARLCMCGFPASAIQSDDHFVGVMSVGLLVTFLAGWDHISYHPSMQLSSKMDISSIKIEKFKRIGSLELGLKQINLLIGGKNSGKS